MKIPHQDAKRLQFFQEICDTCLASRDMRTQQYAQWRSYYYYGTAGDGGPSAWNLIYAHLDQLTSFLYASDSTRFSVRMGAHGQKSDSKRTGPFAKLIMEEWKNSNADIVYQMGILWALVYDSTFVKHIRYRGDIHPFMVDPASMGVYREDVPMLDRQEAFVHVYYMTKSDLEKRIATHPKRKDILKQASDTYSKQDIASATPPIIDRVVLTSGQPGVGMSNVVGEANVPLASVASYAAQIDVPLVEMQEMYIWNDATDDYQTVTMAGGTVVVFDRPNIFLPRTKDFAGEHGFVQICPNPLPDYFWGQSEVSKLAPIQDKLIARMNDIERLEQKQVDPPTMWGGMGLPEDKLGGFNTPGTQISTGDPNFKRETFIPTIPEHVYQSVERFQAQMNTVSGLENVVQGKGESGVRSAGHAGKLLTVGSSRAKKRGQIIEDSLERGATLFGRILYVNEEEPLTDEGGVEFIPSQMDAHFYVEVDAHSNSPLFQENQQNMAFALLKARAITRERLIQAVHPPAEEELLADLKDKIIPAERAAAQAQAAAEAAKAAGGKPPLASVK